MQQVYQAATLMDAQLVCDALMASGIDATIHGSYLSGAIGELPADATPSVWVVDERDAARARAIIDDLLDPTGSPARDWYCSDCGERCGATFRICWNCGAARPA